MNYKCFLSPNDGKLPLIKVPCITIQISASDDMEQRIVCWFSCGAASACATKLAIEENFESEHRKELIVVSINIAEEHSDSQRFLQDCEAWFGQKIIILQNDKYSASVDEVIKQTGHMSGPRGSRCTTVLKKEVRYAFQRWDDIHVFGMTDEEESRLNRLIDNENEIQLWPILIERGMSKKDCLQMLIKRKIKLPEMYLLGYNNNNCIGCLKAGSPGYWNKIRIDFPAVFATRARQEELLNVALIKVKGKRFHRKHPGVIQKILAEEKRIGRKILKPTKFGSIRIPLRFLPRTAGSHKSILVGNCDFFCER